MGFQLRMGEILLEASRAARQVGEVPTGIHMTVRFEHMCSLAPKTSEAFPAAHACKEGTGHVLDDAGERRNVIAPLNKPRPYVSVRLAKFKDARGLEAFMDTGPVDKALPISRRECHDFMSLFLMVLWIS